MSWLEARVTVRAKEDKDTTVHASCQPSGYEDGDLTDMLGELRILLPTAQLLSAFLTTVPFAAGFKAVVQSEKYVFLVTFILAVASLILLSAPAVQHRLLRPLKNRVVFKRIASRQIVWGASTLALALVLVAQFVLSEVLGHIVGTFVAVLLSVLLVLLWWVYPRRWRSSGSL